MEKMFGKQVLKICALMSLLSLAISCVSQTSDLHRESITPTLQRDNKLPQMPFTTVTASAEGDVTSFPAITIANEETLKIISFYEQLPRGDYIVYDNGNGLWAISKDGSINQQLINLSVNATAISNDGHKILISDPGYLGQSVYDLTSSTLKKVDSFEHFFSIPNPVNVHEQLLLGSSNEPLYLYSPNVGRKTVSMNLPENDTFWINYSAWSPDGKWISYSMIAGSNIQDGNHVPLPQEGIYLVNADDARNGIPKFLHVQEPKEHNISLNWPFIWAPTSDKIIFQDNLSNSLLKIYDLNTNKVEALNLEYGTGRISSLSLSPDGQIISYVREDENSVGRIYLIEYDGDSIPQIINGPKDPIISFWLKVE